MVDLFSWNYYMKDAIPYPCTNTVQAVFACGLELLAESAPGVVFQPSFSGDQYSPKAVDLDTELVRPKSYRKTKGRIKTTH